MYIYQLESEFFNNQEQDINFMYEYVVHEKDFSQEEFDKICQEGLETILDRNAYELKRFLELNYGFKNLPINRRFGFSED